jgi:hypothetical protein
VLVPSGARARYDHALQAMRPILRWPEF